LRFIHYFIHLLERNYCSDNGSEVDISISFSVGLLGSSFNLVIPKSSLPKALIAIAASVSVSVSVFAFGKDDFGITRLKEDPNNTPKKGIEISTSDPLVEQ
jgi:hypothetical protein